MLHEAQVCPDGAVGSSQFWIEHLELQSERPDLRSTYTNLVYACRRCNLARRSRSRIDALGRRLLDPCSDTWAEHFLSEGDELLPRTPNAEYTAATYDMNDPVKVALRRDRREAIDESLHVLRTVPILLEQLMQRIGLRPRPEQRLHLEIAEQLHKSLAAARRTLIQLSAVPADASSDCACHLAVCELPETVLAELLQVELEPGRQ